VSCCDGKPCSLQQGGYAKLEEVFDGYLAAFTGRYKRDEARFTKRWMEIFPGARLNALTPTALESTCANLAKGRTPQTVNRFMGFLRRVLNKAIRDGKLASNPLSRFKCFGSLQERRGFYRPMRKCGFARKSGLRTRAGFD
jgi:hypothetical protein